MRCHVFIYYEIYYAITMWLRNIGCASSHPVSFYHVLLRWQCDTHTVTLLLSSEVVTVFASARQFTVLRGCCVCLASSSGDGWATDGESESLSQVLGSSQPQFEGRGHWSFGRVDVGCSVVLLASDEPHCSLCGISALVRIQHVDGRFPPGIAERDVHGFGVICERGREDAFTEGIQGVVDVSDKGLLPVESLRLGKSCRRRRWDNLSKVLLQVGPPRMNVPIRLVWAPPKSFLVVDESLASKRVGDPILVSVGVRTVHGRALVDDGELAVCARYVPEGTELQQDEVATFIACWVFH